MEEKTLDAVRRLLADHYGVPVKVDLRERLDSPHMILRCAVSGDGLPETIIIKHLPGNEDSDAPTDHFRNELANLRFLNDVSGSARLVPHLYAADMNENLFAIEDFGNGGTLQALLLNSTDAVQSEQALITYGAYLGQFHAATAHREAEFKAIQNMLGAVAPMSDTSIDLRSLQPLFNELLAAFDIPRPADFDTEFETIGAAMHEPGPFRTLAHCDARPHNVLLLHESAILIDFDFGQYACCLMDMVSARMGFPHAYKGQRTPAHILQRIEQAYRTELARAIPQAADDNLFQVALAQACAAWALGRLSHYWKGHLKAYLDRGEAINDGQNPAHIDLMKQWQITYTHAVIEVSEAYDCLPATQEVLRSLDSKFRQLWPDLKPLPYYPVFS